MPSTSAHTCNTHFRKIGLIRLVFLSLCLASMNTLFAQSTAYNQLLDKYVRQGYVDYAQLVEDKDGRDLARKYFTEKKLSGLNASQVKAFWIDAYNFTVIDQIAAHYPIQSVKKISGFFKNKHSIAGQSISLNQLEKQLLKDKDGRLHFALVCGAKSCPPLPASGFENYTIEDRLDQVTTEALAQAQIINIENDQLWLSQLFNWYADDIGEPKAFIQQYGNQNIDPSLRIQYMPYDWAINDSKAFQAIATDTPSAGLRYYASNLYAAGEDEWYFFNNNYTQHDSDTDIRSNFFSSFLQYTRGTSKGYNWAIELKFRSVTEGPNSLISPFSSLKMANAGYTQRTEGRTLSRIGLSAITPKIKYQPNKSIAGLTIQHSLAIPLIFSGAEGGDDTGYLDWSTPSILNDIYYDTNLSTRTSMFLQLGLYLENAGSLVVPSRDGYFQFSTPITLIYSYFPNSKSTFYGLINAAPKWGYQFSNSGEDFNSFPDHYNQYGLGYKYFLTDALQMELLVTKFYGVKTERSAATYNLGFRYFGAK